METKSNYKSILKATSILGGVQVFTIIIAIIRSKIIAVWLGPEGMAIAGLFTSATNLVSGFTNLGIGTSAIRNVAVANSSRDERHMAKIVSVLKKLVWVTGFFGLLFTFFMASTLSVLTFGSDNYTIAFKWLSLTLLLSQLTTGQNVLLQGLGKYKLLAKANLISSLISLVISVPVYFIYKMDGIVPALIITSSLTFIVTWWISKKYSANNIDLDKKEFISESKSIIGLGVLLSISGIITLVVSYLVRIYISNYGNLNDVGLYSAGFAIVGTYVGLVFTAMNTDYYPKLSAVAHHKVKANTLINEQVEMTILIIGPIICVFLIFAEKIIVLLYSTQFTPITEMVRWAALGMFFKAASFPLGYLILAKGAAKTFFWSELVANLYILLFNVLWYKFFGLTGLGISFLISYILVLIQIIIISRWLYDFKFGLNSLKLLVIHLCIGILCYLSTTLLESTFSFLCGTILILLSIAYSLKVMNEKINLMEVISKLKNKI